MKYFLWLGIFLDFLVILFVSGCIKVIYIKYSVLDGFRVDEKRSLREAEDDIVKIVRAYEVLGVPDCGEILVK